MTPGQGSVAAQYVATLLPHVPAAVLADPGSRECREAFRAAAEDCPVPLHLSRRVIVAALAELRRHATDGGWRP